MDITLPFEELCRMMADFTQIGFMEAVKAYEPAQDRIRARDVRNWLKMMLVDEKRFDALVRCGKIRARRMGTGKNSPIYYSKKEIKEALVASRMFTAGWNMRKDE